MIAMKGYSTFPKAPALLERHHQIVFCYNRTLLQTVNSTAPANYGTLSLSLIFSKLKVEIILIWNEIKFDASHFFGVSSPPLFLSLTLSHPPTHILSLSLSLYLYLSMSLIHSLSLSLSLSLPPDLSVYVSLFFYLSLNLSLKQAYQNFVFLAELYTVKTVIIWQYL